MYDALVALHVISAVIGFGAVAVTGVYGGMAGARREGGTGARREGGTGSRREGWTGARREGAPASQGDDETRRYFTGRLRAEWLLLIVPFLGAAALAAGPKRHEAGDLWVLASAGLWLVAAGLLVRVIRPAERRIRAIVAGTADGDLRSAARTVMRASIVTDLVFVVALALMVAQPG